MKLRTTVKVGIPSLLTGVLVLAGCSSNAEPNTEASNDPAADAPVTISISDLPSTENQEERDRILALIDQFEDDNPLITVEPEETVWTADTFQAMLAGGTMPTVMTVPFTDIGSLMEREQIADLTDHLGDSTILDDLNPALLASGTDADGNVRGIPIAAYTMGLIYNRALFDAAGLDPDDPPQTWDEVREAAKVIEANTDAQGFQAMTLDNTGGWALTTMSYAFGSTLVAEDGATASVANDATAEALEFYRTLRWEDDTFGDNFLLGYGDVNNNFAGGQVGMYVQGADSYINLVINLGMDPQDFGLAPLPQAPDGLGTLGGGNLAVVNPAATPEQIAAGLKWVEFRYFEKYVDQEVAVAQAQAAADSGAAVGFPELRIVGEESYAQWLEWVADYINAPRENYELYLSTVDQLPLVPEPAPSGQEIYATLDPIVQGVLTRQDADIAELLAGADATVQGILDAANS